MEEMDLRELSRRVHVPVRRLRYVLDHELVPNRHWFVADSEAGTPRKFDAITAVFIACAAFLLDVGYRRESIREFMKAVGQLYPEGRNPLRLPILANAMVSNADATIAIGDATHVRCTVGNQNSGWYRIGNKPTADKSYVPKVVIQVDLSQIRDLIQAAD